jgi:hypothetical protein
MAQRQQPVNDEVAHTVLFRQRFGDLPAGRDGLLTVGVKADGSVVYATSSVTGDRTLSGDQRLDAVAAITAAAEDVEFEVGSLTPAAAGLAGFQSFASAWRPRRSSRGSWRCPPPRTASGAPGRSR